MLQVTIDMFSGRRNPTWTLSHDESQDLLKKISGQRGVVSTKQGHQGLGYRGIRIEALSEESMKGFDLPSTFYIANGSSEDEEAGIEIARELGRAGFGRPLGLASLDGREIIDDRVAARFSEQLDNFKEVAARYLAMTIQCPGEAPPAPPNIDAVACTFDATPYNPNWWNNDQYRLLNNNCYAYACNIATNTFPQPGRWGGFYPYPFYCNYVYHAATIDGLVDYTDCQPDSSYPRYLVALVIDPTVDYHWYRRASERYWGHKPGSTLVRNWDDSGNTIWDPQTCNRGGYTDFCGWMCAPNTVHIR